MKLKSIPLFWWSTIKFHNKKYENFGDLIAPYLVKKITRKKIKFIQPKKRKWDEFFTKVYLTTGSILAHADKKCIVWGSGLIEKTSKVPKATFLAVRGPITRNLLLKQGHDIPEIYGDPAILLPKYYSPISKKKHKIGIIPHNIDYEMVNNWYGKEKDINVINLATNSVENVIEEIYSCDTVISSSLHGIIVAHAYNIPAVWVKFSNNLFGDGIKFYDYFESVGLNNIEYEQHFNKLEYPELLKITKSKKTLVSNIKIQEIQNNLMNVCPF